MNIYVVNYKEILWDGLNIGEVSSGVCDVGYLNESDAVKKCWELSDSKINEFLDEENGDNSNISRDSNDSGDWQCVKHRKDSYEYWVSVVDVSQGGL